MKHNHPVTTLLAVPAGAAAVFWLADHRTGSVAGLVVLAAVFVTAWPAAVLAVVVGCPYWCALLLPREWRANYRNRRDRHGDMKRPRTAQRSQYLPKWLCTVVRAADCDRCVYCGQAVSGVDAHTDHRVPWSFGGLSMLPNLFLLCAEHNITKMTFWVDRRGVEHGKSSDRALARQIFTAEQRARRSVLRWVRIVWALS